jgi:hypothetical protein
MLELICGNLDELHLTAKLIMGVFYTILLFLIIIICSNCNDQAPSKKDTDVNFFDPMLYGAINHSGGLSIETRFSECGEWGGHKEEVLVYADSTQRFHADYQVFPYNCDSLPFYLANDNREPIISKSIIVQQKAKKAIISYIQRLIQSKTNERFVDGASNTGNFFFNRNSRLDFLHFGSEP